MNPTTQQIVARAYTVLTRLSKDGDAALRQAAYIEHSIGFTRPSVDAPVQGGDTTSVVERAMNDPELANATALRRSLTRYASVVEELDRALTGVLPAHNTDRHPPGSGACSCCTRWVSGSATDRIRRGLCETCRQAVRRMVANDPNLETSAAVSRRRRALATTPAADLEPHT
jgi:hypothetical protein